MSVLHQPFIFESLRRLREGQERIHACAKRLTDEQIWHRPNGNTVSVGNQVLHLTGNVGQWINSTLGARPDLRERDREFNEVGPVDRRAFMERFDATLAYAYDVIDGLTEADLARVWTVQGFSETGLSIVFHVVEHFSYHVGQVTLHTKLALDIDTGYYNGQNLNATGSV
jgi:uncharacterized damage-inducible protein DinB